MENSKQTSEDKRFHARALEVTLRIGFVLLLIAWCFWIIMPFIAMIVWGLIIAVAVYPMHSKLLSAIGNRRKLAAAISTLLLLALFLVPAAALTESLITGAQGLYEQLSSGEIKVPPPPEGLGSWPIIGKSIEKTWRQASTNLDTVLEQFAPELTKMAGTLLSAIAGTGLSLLQFLLATIIAGAVLANAEAAQVTARGFAVRMAGDSGKEFTRVTKETVRSVARGILGVALIQALLAGLGFLVVGLPAAGLLAMICLLLAIIQLGVGLVTIPAAIYIFYTADTVTAVVFLIWCIVVTVIDNVLKPILLGRGAPVPMIVIFLGVIGGFLSQGIIGLFLGAVILSLGFNLYQTWVDQTPESEA